MRVQICTPTYIEAENIEEFLQRTRTAMPEADILVLDDNSPDGTADIAERVAAELGHIEVLRRPEKRGLGNAYRAGFAVGVARGYDIVCQIDADLSHDPAVLPDLIAAIDDGADLAIGSRYVPGGAIPHWPVRRLALSRYGNKYARFMLQTGIKDTSAGFRAYRTDLLEAIDFASTRAKGYGFQLELAYRASRWGARTVELPITFTDRARGQSKMSAGVIAEEMLLMTWWGIRDRFKRTRATAS